MQIEGFTLRWDDVPPDYRPCFTAACPRSAECLRYAAGQCLPRSLTCGPAIYPTALPDGEGAASGCPHFRPRRVVRTAWGFRSLFRDVLARHAPSLRSSLMGLLGSESTYYRYHRGERRLTPEQQQEVARIFRRYGYGDAAVTFDHYREEIDFSDA